MYLAPDSSSNSGAKTDVASFSWNHTCSGINRILVVGIGSQIAVSSITYGGQALTQVTGVVGGESSRSEIWVLKNPPTGTNPIAVTLSSTASRCAGGALSLTGADQVSPVHKFDEENGISNPAITLTTTIPNTYIFDILYHAQTSPSPSVGAGQTPIFGVTPDGSDFVGGSYKAFASVGAVSMSWVRTGAHAYCAVAILEVQPQGGFLMNFV